MTTKIDLAQSRKETAADFARIITTHLEDATESLRRALARSEDSALELEQRLPESLAYQILNLRLAIKIELARRSR